MSAMKQTDFLIKCISLDFRLCDFQGKRCLLVADKSSEHTSGSFYNLTDLGIVFVQLGLIIDSLIVHY